MQHALFDFLGSALIPELGSDVAAGSSGHVHFILITVAAIRALPYKFSVFFHNLNLSGSTGLDQTIDYTGKIKLPASAGNISKMMTLDLKIGGSFTSPKVSVDTKSMANQAVEAVANEAISKLGEKLGLDSATTANKDSIKQKVTEKAAEKALELLKKIK